MKNNKEKFLDLVSKEKTNTTERNRERIKNRKRLRESQEIAIKVLKKLEEPGWNQRRLAKEMGVSPQQITKIIKGKENLTLETIVKLQDILNIPILFTFLEKAEKEKIAANVKISDNTSYSPADYLLHEQSYVSQPKSYNMSYDAAKDKYEFEPQSA